MMLSIHFDHVLSIIFHGTIRTCSRVIKKVLHFTSRFTRQPSSGEGITFGGTKIEILLGKQETYYINMGVIMNNNLSFSTHNNQELNYICKKKKTILSR